MVGERGVRRVATLTALALVQRQEMDIAGGTTGAQSVLVRAEAWLHESADHWNALEFVASRKDMARYDSVLDFVLCEIIPQERYACRQFYEGRGGNLASVRSERMIAYEDSRLLGGLLRGTLRAAKAVVDAGGANRRRDREGDVSDTKRAVRIDHDPADVPAMRAAKGLHAESVHPSIARTIAEFIRRKLGIVMANVEELESLAPTDAPTHKPLAAIQVASDALVAFANELYLPPVANAKPKKRISIHPATTQATISNPITGDLVFMIVQEAVIVHIPIGVTISSVPMVAGDTVRAGMCVVYSKLVLEFESGGQDLSFEAECVEQPE